LYQEIDDFGDSPSYLNAMEFDCKSIPILQLFYSFLHVWNFSHHIQLHNLIYKGSARSNEPQKTHNFWVVTGIVTGQWTWPLMQNFHIRNQ